MDGDADDDGGGGPHDPSLDKVSTGPNSSVQPRTKLVGLSIEVLPNENGLQFSPNGNGGLDIKRKSTFDFQKPGPLLPENLKISPLHGSPLNQDPNIVRPPPAKGFTRIPRLVPGWFISDPNRKPRIGLIRNG